MTINLDPLPAKCGGVISALQSMCYTLECLSPGMRLRVLCALWVMFVTEQIGDEEQQEAVER